MTSNNQQDAVLVGGPRDGLAFASAEAGLAELEIEGFLHRYIRTTTTREDGDASYVVYNYDGMIDPDGAEDGAESSDRRNGAAPGAVRVPTDGQAGSDS